MSSTKPGCSTTEPLYAIGDTVRVIQGYPIGHCRTPAYFRNTLGIIERYCGAYPNPEELAYGRDGLPAIHLYRVRNLMRNLWPEYDQQSPDSIEVEVYEHWLKPAP